MGVCDGIGTTLRKGGTTPRKDCVCEGGTAGGRYSERKEKKTSNEPSMPTRKLVVLNWDCRSRALHKQRQRRKQLLGMRAALIWGWHLCNV